MGTRPAARAADRLCGRVEREGESGGAHARADPVGAAKKHRHRTSRPAQSAHNRCDRAAVFVQAWTIEENSLIESPDTAQLLTTMVQSEKKRKKAVRNVTREPVVMT